MKKDIQLDDFIFHLSLSEPIRRYRHNPILTAHDVNKVWAIPKHKVMTVHNAGVTDYGNEVIMLFRSHLRNGISVIGKAKSKNGLSDWSISKKPFLVPCNEQDVFSPGLNIQKLIENEAGGVEDPRITKIGDTFYITYSAYHGLKKDRVRVSLASTHDFETVTRHGPVLERDMRNVVIFPEKIDAKYFALMRPNDDPKKTHTGGIFKEVVIATNG